jgi:hypothetical protein
MDKSLGQSEIWPLDLTVCVWRARKSQPVVEPRLTAPKLVIARYRSKPDDVESCLLVEQWAKQETNQGADTKRSVVVVKSCSLHCPPMDNWHFLCNERNSVSCWHIYWRIMLLMGCRESAMFVFKFYAELWQGSERNLWHTTNCIWKWNYLLFENISVLYRFKHDEFL